MITKMARPEEVLIVQDENDPESIIQEVMKDTDAIMLYKVRSLMTVAFL